MLTLQRETQTNLKKLSDAMEHCLEDHPMGLGRREDSLTDFLIFMQTRADNVSLQAQIKEWDAYIDNLEVHINGASS